MKNSFILILVITAFLFQSCTVETLDVGIGLLAGDNEDGSVYLDEIGAITKNFSRGEYSNFIAPIQYEDDIIFFDDGLRSVNKNNGLENWNLENESISSAIEPKIVDDKLYLIDDNKIYKIELSTGVILLKQQWRFSDHIDRKFNIVDGIMYVSFTQKEKTYSGFASSALEDLTGVSWVDLFTIPTNNIFTNIKGAIVGVNLEGEHIIYYTTEASYVTGQSLKVADKVHAYNTFTNEEIWTYTEAQESVVYEGIVLNELDQVIVKSQTSIVSLSTQTGQKKWWTPLSEDVHNYARSSGMIKHNNILITIRGLEIATAYNISSGQKLWTLDNISPDSFLNEIGMSRKSVNFFGDTMYYLSAKGFLMEVDLSTGNYIKHHELLQFSGGLIVDEDENFITFLEHTPHTLLSFSL